MKEADIDARIKDLKFDSQADVANAISHLYAERDRLEKAEGAMQRKVNLKKYLGKTWSWFSDTDEDFQFVKCLEVNEYGQPVCTKFGKNFSGSYFEAGVIHAPVTLDNWTRCTGAQYAKAKKKFIHEFKLATK